MAEARKRKRRVTRALNKRPSRKTGKAIREAVAKSHASGARSAALKAGQRATAVTGGPQFAAARYPELIKAVSATTKQAVRRIIRDGLDAGKGADAIASDLQKQFRAWKAKAPGKQSRAERISRTETGEAYNRGAIEQYRELGIKKVLVFDGEEDAECAKANGQIWTLRRAEANPLGHPNCVRSFSPAPE